MPARKRKPKVGGARPGAGRKPLDPSEVRSVKRLLGLTEREAAMHDRKCGDQAWAAWIRDLAERAPEP